MDLHKKNQKVLEAEVTFLIQIHYTLVSPFQPFVVDRESYFAEPWTHVDVKLTHGFEPQMYVGEIS